MDFIIDGEASVRDEAPSVSPVPEREPAFAPVILGNLSDEITRCADMVADLQDAFGSAQVGSSTLDIKRMQSLDLLEQTLRDLSAVTATMAEQGVDCRETDFVKHCKLDDVARRLEGRAVAAHCDDADFF